MFKEGNTFRALDQSALEEKPEFSKGGQVHSRQAARAGRVFEAVDKSTRPDFYQTGRYLGRVLRAMK